MKLLFTLNELQAAFKSGQMLGENAMGIISDTPIGPNDINYRSFNEYVENEYEIDSIQEIKNNY